MRLYIIEGLNCCQKCLEKPIDDPLHYRRTKLTAKPQVPKLFDACIYGLVGFAGGVSQKPMENINHYIRKVYPNWDKCHLPDWDTCWYLPSVLLFFTKNIVCWIFLLFILGKHSILWMGPSAS